MPLGPSALNMRFKNDHVPSAAGTSTEDAHKSATWVRGRVNYLGSENYDPFEQRREQKLLEDDQPDRRDRPS